MAKACYEHIYIKFCTYMIAIEHELNFIIGVHTSYSTPEMVRVIPLPMYCMHDHLRIAIYIYKAANDLCTSIQQLTKFE